MSNIFRSLKLTSFVLLVFGVALALISGLVMYESYTDFKSYSLEEAKMRAQMLLDRNLATHHYFSNQLKPDVFKVVDRLEDEDYFEPSWMSSTYAVREIDKLFKEISVDNYYYKEAAINARSPANEADAEEAEFIVRLNNDSAFIYLSRIRTIGGEQYYEVLRRGETMEEDCLRCHGDPADAPKGLVDFYGDTRSFGRHAGEAVSAISIRVPIEGAFALASDMSWELFYHFITLIIATLLLTYAVFRVAVNRPMAMLENHARNVAFGHAATHEGFSVGGFKEIESLSASFAEMLKRLERQHALIRESEQTLEYALDATSDGYWDWDISSGRVVFSDKWLRSLGYERAEVEPKVSFWEGVVHPDDMPKVRNALDLHFEGKSDYYECVNRLLKKSGEYRWNLDRGRVIVRDENGMPLRMVGTDTDITERIKAEEGLRQYEHIVASSSDMMALLNRQFMYVAANDAYVNAFGKSRDEFAGHTVGEVFGVEFFEEVIKPHAVKCLAGAEVKYNAWFDFPHAGRKYMDVHYYPYVDARGKVEGLVVNARDITEQRMAEEERERLATAIEQSADTIVITDTHGDIVYTNPAFERITGYVSGEVIGKNSRILQSGRHDNEFYENLWSTIISGRTWGGVFTNKRKDGTVFEERATISPVFDAKGGIVNYVAVKRDVTAEMDLERARAFFTDAASHELRKPLTQLKLLQVLFGDLMQAHDGDATVAKSKDMADQIYVDLERIVSATSLQSELLSEVKVPFYPIVMKPLLECQVEAVRHEIRHEGRSISIHADLDGLPEDASILGSVEMVVQAFKEILSNAIKYSLDGSCVSVVGTVAGGEVVVEVLNEGVGIPKEKIEGLFAPYFSLENVLEHSTGKYKYKGGGIGLGLTVAKLVAEYHGGSIEIKSVAGKGETRVILRFPFVR